MHWAGECEEHCPYCRTGSTAEITYDNYGITVEDIQICPSCGDMMIPSNVHECGMVDPA